MKLVPEVGDVVTLTVFQSLRRFVFHDVRVITTRPDGSFTVDIAGQALDADPCDVVAYRSR